ncbi:MAG: hypothetical protein WC815_22910 [Vicinamibacterales bacterium]|jgi:hypothetical protein
MDARSQPCPPWVPAHPPSENGNPLVDMQTMAHSSRRDDPGIGLRHNGRQVLTYANPPSTFDDMENAMTRRSVVTSAALLVLTAMAASRVSAHPGHDHKIMGTVTMAAVDHVMIKDLDGKEFTVTINKDTKFMRARKPMKATDMKMGMRIVITAVTDADDDKSIATVIELGPDVATK